jgi:hypothetical protein
MTDRVRGEYVVSPNFLVEVRPNVFSHEAAKGFLFLPDRSLESGQATESRATRHPNSTEVTLVGWWGLPAASVAVRTQRGHAPRHG